MIRYVLRELHTILVELFDLSACATLVQDALTHNTAIHPSGCFWLGYHSWWSILPVGFAASRRPLQFSSSMRGRRNHSERYSVAPRKGGQIRIIGVFVRMTGNMTTMIDQLVPTSAKEVLYKL